ncbi:MAG: S49 family peptidase [Prolixibacteraceae bacterium]
MNYSFLKDVIGSPWQVEVQTLNGLLPILKGMISGLSIEKGEEPQNHLSYTIPASFTSQEDICDEDDNEPEVEEYSPKVINIIPLRSVLTKHDQDCGPRGTRTLANRLLKADAESNVIGHILVVESGGGQVNAVPEMTEAMLKCTKPIVVWIDGMAASAAYYISCYAKEIIASRDLDVVGCIGTMLVWEGRKSKSEANEEGDIQVTIYADGAEEKNAEYEQAINEFNFQPAKERMLNPLNAKFKTDVKSQRSAVTDDQLKGKTYFAGEVIGTLIDSIGTFEFAVERVKILANYKNNSSAGGNQKSNNSKPMAKQFLLLNQTLNVEVLESTEEGVFLNEEQLQSIEQGLELNQQLATERDNALAAEQTANTTIGTLQQQVTDAQAAAAAVIDPFNAIDPTIASAETPEAKVAAIRALLAAKPGANPVQIVGPVEEHETEEADWETINNLPHNKLVDSNL